MNLPSKCPVCDQPLQSRTKTFNEIIRYSDGGRIWMEYSLRFRFLCGMVIEKLIHDHGDDIPEEFSKISEVFEKALEHKTDYQILEPCPEMVPKTIKISL